jgi:DNA invertase Pin-like site-specific DNA recombinase
MRCRAYCHKHGVTVGLVVHDVHRALSLDRPNLNHIIEWAENGRMDLLVVDSLTRLNRANLKATYEYIMHLDSLGVHTVILEKDWHPDFMTDETVDLYKKWAKHIH